MKRSQDELSEVSRESCGPSYTRIAFQLVFPYAQLEKHHDEPVAGIGGPQSTVRTVPIALNRPIYTMASSVSEI